MRIVWPLLCVAPVQFGADPIVVRVEELPLAGGRVFHGDSFIAGYARCLAHPDNGLGNAWPAIAVDHQSGVAGQNRERIERARKLDGDPRRADIPGNVPLQILRGHT